MDWRLATWPTRRSPDLVKATTEGVVRPPSLLAMTLGSPFSITATTLLVVPRSMPIIFAMVKFPAECSRPDYKAELVIVKYYFSGIASTRACKGLMGGRGGGVAGMSPFDTI